LRGLALTVVEALGMALGTRAQRARRAALVAAALGLHLRMPGFAVPHVYDHRDLPCITSRLVRDRTRCGLNASLGMHVKVHRMLPDGHALWRQNLGELLESCHVMGAIAALIVVDLAITAFVHLVEDTQILNPAHKRVHENISSCAKRLAIAILVVFVVEQLGHFVAFGRHFFSKPWFVLDLGIVLGTLILELSEGRIEEEGKRSRRLSPKKVAHIMVAVRLWKACAFCFDIGYLSMTQHLINQGGLDAANAYIAVLKRALIAGGIPVPGPL